MSEARSLASSALGLNQQPATARSAADPVINRVVRILNAFGPDEQVLSVTQIAVRSQLHVATASRLIEQLTSVGLLGRDDTRRVHVGLRLWELAARAAPTRTLREAALPFLKDLHTVVGHHAQIGILDGYEVLSVEKLSAPNAVVNYSRVAGRLPLHATSSGWVLLADAPASIIEHVLAAGLPAYTATTQTDPVQLRRAIAHTRRQGFAVNPGHMHAAATSIAAPIRDSSGHTTATVSVIVPNDPSALSMVPVVRAAALGISRALLSH